LVRAEKKGEMTGGFDNEVKNSIHTNTNRQTGGGRKRRRQKKEREGMRRVL